MENARGKEGKVSTTSEQMAEGGSAKKRRQRLRLQTTKESLRCKKLASSPVGFPRKGRLLLPKLAFRNLAEDLTEGRALSSLILGAYHQASGAVELFSSTQDLMFTRNQVADLRPAVVAELLKIPACVPGSSNIDSGVRVFVQNEAVSANGPQSPTGI